MEKLQSPKSALRAAALHFIFEMTTDRNVRRLAIRRSVIQDELQPLVLILVFLQGPNRLSASLFWYALYVLLPFPLE